MLQDKIDRLIVGWYERVEYAQRVGEHQEIRVMRVKHPALLIELWNMTASLKTGPSNGGSANKPGSRPPGSIEAASLIQEIRCYARELRGNWSDRPVLRRPTAGELRAMMVLAQHQDDSEISDVNYRLQQYIRRGLVMLGHEAPTRMLDSSVCGECGGGLSVADDASSAVRCVGYPDAPSCGNSYPPHTWLELAQGIEHGDAGLD